MTNQPNSLLGPGTIAWLSIFSIVLLWSGYQPKETFTWFLEVAPALIAIGVLGMTRRKFPLTSLAYILILGHSLILMVGGHYTYAEVPLFDLIKEPLGWERNNYDKLGHLAQGFVPVIITREILIRNQVVNGAIWTHFLAVSFCLAFSAFYELLEWWVALASGASAESFLGTQGYVWDTQSDMAWALFGAVLALTILSTIHNRQISALPSVESS
jgi:putative membrane protein